MPYLIGMDEAGYGPNMGPLTISATVWRTVQKKPRDLDLYGALGAAITDSPASGERRIAIADSKRLYKPGSGLRLLERGLFPALAIAKHLPETWQGLWEVLAADTDHARDALPWYKNYEEIVPLAVSLEELEPLVGSLRQGLGSAGVELQCIRSRAIFPEQLNSSIERYGTKGEVLTRCSLRLLADVIESLHSEPIFVVCDKHGGRNRYGKHLQQVFAEVLVEVRKESRAESLYRFGSDESRIEIAFRAGGEAFLPSALASMACKYLRELSMRAFNAFWRERVPGIKPTAGYPVDAKRFRREIASVQSELGIEDRILWRNR